MKTPTCLRLTAICAILSVLGVALSGCARKQVRPTITAVGLSPANQCEPAGIPYYLPKPLLVVAKNFRHIDESKVGLTGPAPIPAAFDNQAAYADIKANVTVPGTTATPASDGTTNSTFNLTGDVEAPEKSMVAPTVTPPGRVEDGLAPDSFFTYQVIFVPDLTQKYGLQITGGAGEIRAAMNMVNGWMYTGMGPFYLKDSSSAQNAMATGVGSMFAGRGAADVINEVGELTTAIGSLPKAGNEGAQFDQIDRVSEQMKSIARAADSALMVQHDTMLNYAEIFIYEPYLTPDGRNTEWRMIAHHNFHRDYLRFQGDNEAFLKHRADIFKSLIFGVSGDEPFFDNSNGDEKKDTPTDEETSDEAGDGDTESAESDQDADDAFGNNDGSGGGGRTADAPDLSRQIGPVDPLELIGIRRTNQQMQPGTGNLNATNNDGTVQPIQINVNPEAETTTTTSNRRGLFKGLFRKPNATVTNRVGPRVGYIGN